jgi:hypothetical protein
VNIKPLPDQWVEDVRTDEDEIEQGFETEYETVTRTAYDVVKEAKAFDQKAAKGIRWNDLNYKIRKVCTLIEAETLSTHIEELFKTLAANGCMAHDGEGHVTFVSPLEEPDGIEDMEEFEEETTEGVSRTA